jgi:hypothetical protein
MVKKNPKFKTAKNFENSHFIELLISYSEKKNVEIG